MRDDFDVNDEYMFKLLPGNIFNVEVEAWLRPSIHEQDLTYEEIFTAVNNTEDTPIEKDIGIFHTADTKILDEALRYTE